MRLRARFIRCLTALAGVLEGRQEWNIALDCYQRALEVDDRAEEFYQGLIRCFASLGQP
jgi:tetratricopeptide (TPR) repeat protein